MAPYTIGYKIQTLRKSLKLSQADLAKKIQVAPVTVSKWEIETSKPKGPSLLKLSKLFNVAIDVLLDDGAPIQMLREQVEVPFYPGMNQLKDISDKKNREIREIFLIDKSFVDRPESTIALRVSGDSMTPVFSDNAIVFLDTTRNVVSDGKVYVIIHEQLVRIKVLENIPGGYRLKSYNSNYPPEDVLLESEVVKVVGQVTAQIQKY